MKWIVIPDERVLNITIAAGMNPRIAAGFVEMNVSTHSSKWYEDYYLNMPVLGKMKLKDYATEFVMVYDQN